MEICRGLPSITGIAGAEPCRKTGNHKKRKRKRKGQHYKTNIEI